MSRPHRSDDGWPSVREDGYSRFDVANTLVSSLQGLGWLAFIGLTLLATSAFSAEDASDVALVSSIKEEESLWIAETNCAKLLQEHRESPEALGKIHAAMGTKD